MTRGPTIVRVPPGGGGAKGIKCCCCRCCECLNLGYLTSHHGLIKLAEAVSKHLYSLFNSIHFNGKYPVFDVTIAFIVKFSQAINDFHNYVLT